MTERLKWLIFEEEKIKELCGKILMSAKVAKKEGKGYSCPAFGHMVELERKVTGDRRKLLAMAQF